MTDPHDVGDDEVEEYAKDLLERTREELVRADQKAALLLAGAGVAVGSLLTGLLGGKWSPFQLANSIEWLWWCGVVAALAGVAFIGSAVYPRTRRRGAAWSGIAYFGDVVAAGRESLEEELRATIASGKSPLVDQLFQNSRIVDRKYWGLRNGLRCLVASIALCGLSILINAAILA